MWSEGTQLRGDDGFYLWPPVADGPQFALDAKRYPSYSRIQKLVYGEPDIAHATWVAQEAQRLFALHTAGLPAHHAELVLSETGFERVIEEVDPATLIQDADYLRKFGWRMSGRAADRGTVVHKLIRHWHVEGPVHPSDIPYWVDDVIGFGDGVAPYRCDVDETTGYCLSLAHWLSETGFIPAATEIPGFRDGKMPYACTLDVVGGFPGDNRLYVVDVKTSAQSNRFHALQLTAQTTCDWYGVPGTANQLQHAEVFPSKPVAASLLVQPGKATFRVCTPQPAAWEQTLSLYYGLFTSEMPFSTDKARVTHVPIGGAA
jgi:hypothetical protein